jgi:hypothetical protein
VTGDAPWTSKNVVISAVLAGIGGLLCVISWFRVSGDSAARDQLGMLNVSAVGLALVGVGYAQWFLAGRRACGVRRRLLLTPAGHVPTTAAADAAELYVGSERFFHRMTCAMAGDRGWEAADKNEHLNAGRVACGVCTP